jgi:hypothetical protein
MPSPDSALTSCISNQDSAIGLAEKMVAASADAWSGEQNEANGVAGELASALNAQVTAVNSATAATQARLTALGQDPGLGAAIAALQAAIEDAQTVRTLAIYMQRSITSTLWTP